MRETIREPSHRWVSPISAGILAVLILLLIIGGGLAIFSGTSTPGPQIANAATERVQVRQWDSGITVYDMPDGTRCYVLVSPGGPAMGCVPASANVQVVH